MDTQELQKLKARYDIVGSDPALSHALEMAVQVADTDLTVLITGESGVGKETFPRIIHDGSARRRGKYLAVNCGAIPEGTINAELFGHEKGAFTGAVGERKGYFEEADGGTLFLDEIGELPRETQALLLRVLQNGEYMKVGSSKVEKTDVRVICATNVNLAHAVATGKFREDLYYRLNGVQIMVPSLRERKEDIYLLFRKFSYDFAEKYNRCKVTLSFDAIALLRSYRWPGNIRQLKNIAETVTALESKPFSPTCEKIELGPDILAKYLPDEGNTLLPAMASQPSSDAMPDEDKRMIIKAIFDLKAEVDRLKEIIGGGATAAVDRKPAADLPAAVNDLQADDAEWQEQPQPAPQPEVLSIKKANADLIDKALERHGGNIKEAAAELGISERTIYRKIAARKKQ